MTGLREKELRAQVAVIGGGLAGMMAAIAAARHGTKVVLMQERPMLGGNASSEIRMWVCGCHGDNNRETGILEEMLLRNMYRNPNRNYSVWDSVMLEMVQEEPNITLLLNCSCNHLEMDGGRIHSVRGWQMTTYTWYTVKADYFIDCSGDSILAPMCGAEFRVGREASSEFGENIAPAVADKKTMGMSCLLQTRELGHPVEFIPPKWAYVYEDDSKFYDRGHTGVAGNNFWWIELGGVQDSIHDTEEVRDELLKVAYGVWDHIKNRGDHGADNWDLDWVGILPGKRESRRYVGDHILTQNDVRAEGKFDDLVAYGGWTMDDHHPEGFDYPGHPTIFHPAPTPFGIPYRCLYSRNVENLLFAGRNISTTHTALSSCRVMGTCAILGQAAGTAAAIAAANGLSPRQVYEQKIGELQATLMEDDCYLPWHVREISPLTRQATIDFAGEGAENLRNGKDRTIDGVENGCFVELGQAVTFSWARPEHIGQLRLVLDSNLNRDTVEGQNFKQNMSCCYLFEQKPYNFPTTMVKEFDVEYRTAQGEWKLLAHEVKNHRRLVRIPVGVETDAIRWIPRATWGSEKAHIFSMEVNE